MVLRNSKTRDCRFTTSPASLCTRAVMVCSPLGKWVVSSRNAITGALTLVQTIDGLASRPTELLISPDGAHVYLGVSDTVRIYAEQILVRSQETLELARESYRVGKSTILPVLESQRNLLAARRDHLQRLRQAATALSDLELATGVPRETLLSPPPRKQP